MHRSASGSADVSIEGDGPVGQRAIFAARTLWHEAVSAPPFRMFARTIAIRFGARGNGPVMIRPAVQALRTERHKNSW